MDEEDPLTRAKADEVSSRKIWEAKSLSIATYPFHQILGGSFKLSRGALMFITLMFLGAFLIFFLFALGFSKIAIRNLDRETTGNGIATGSISGMDANAFLLKHSIIGDVIDKVQLKQLNFVVKYGRQEVKIGAHMMPKDTVEAPQVAVGGTESSESSTEHLYTLVMVDPDAPSPREPAAREWLHWIVVNIPGGTTVPSTGLEIVEYNGPTPPIGVHRYVFVLFQQLGPLKVEPPKARNNFNTRMFAKEYQLGYPVAVTFFNAEKDYPGVGSRHS